MGPIVVRARVPVKQADARDVSPKQRDGDLDRTSSAGGPHQDHRSSAASAREPAQPHQSAAPHPGARSCPGTGACRRSATTSITRVRSRRSSRIAATESSLPARRARPRPHRLTGSSVRAKERSAAFDAAYALVPGIPRCALMEALRTTAPRNTFPRHAIEEGFDLSRVSGVGRQRPPRSRASSRAPLRGSLGSWLGHARGLPGYFAGSFPGAVVGAGAAPGGDEPGDTYVGSKIPPGTGILLPLAYMHCRYVMS